MCECRDEAERAAEFLYESRCVSQSVMSRGESGGKSELVSDTEMRGGMGSGRGEAGVDCVGGDGTCKVLLSTAADVVSRWTFRLNQEGDGGANEVRTDGDCNSASPGYGDAVSSAGFTRL